MPPLAPPPRSPLLSESYRGSQVQELGLKKERNHTFLDFLSTWRPHQADMGSWESEKREKERSDSSNCLHVASTLLRSIKFQRCWGSFSSLKLCGDNLSANQQMLRSCIGAIRSCQVHVKLKTRQFELLSHFKKRHKDPESCPRFFLYENVGAFFCGISQIQIFTWSHFSLTSWVTTHNS